MVVKTRARVHGAAPKQSTHKKLVEKNPPTNFMLGDNKESVAPSGLIDSKVKVPAAKMPKVRKPKTPATTKLIAKPPSTRKPRVKAVAKIVTQPAPVMIAVQPVIAPPVHSLANVPLTRNKAPVLWQKNGAMGAIGYWLRATGRNVMARIGAKAKRPRTQAPIGSKLRTKNDLLREIAALREENAVMRDRLGLPPMPYGRMVADTV
jgi:hypothetical protein